jgi:hypothetical protein
VLVGFVSEGQVRLAGRLDGTPFGSVDLPGDAAACVGPSMRFAGWALDDRGVEEVVLVGETMGPAARSLGVIGRATWHTGRRPDVAAAFSSYPSADRAEWNFQLPCDVIRNAGGPVRIRVLARDANNPAVELGAREVR